MAAHAGLLAEFIIFHIENQLAEGQLHQFVAGPVHLVEFFGFHVNAGGGLAGIGVHHEGDTQNGQQGDHGQHDQQDHPLAFPTAGLAGCLHGLNPPEKRALA